MIKLKNILNNKCVENEFNQLTSCFLTLTEGRVSDFQKKYSSIPRYIADILIENDPSKSHKYLNWLGKVVSTKIKEARFVGDDALELMNWITIFHHKIKGIDIYSFKELDDFVDFMVEKTKEVGNRQKIERQATLLFLNSHVRVVAPETHESSMHFGGSTRWCISTSSEGHWENYYCEQGNSIVFVIFRKTGEKYAIVGDRLDYAAIYDSADHTIGSSERNELMSQLQEEEDSNGNNAWNAIDDHFYDDDRDERRVEYEEKKLKDEFEEYGKKDLNREIKTIIIKHLNVNDEVEDEIDWHKYIVKAFGSIESYYNFLELLWYGSASYWGNDNAGSITDLDDISRYDAGYEDEFKELIHLVNDYVTNTINLNNIVRNTLNKDAYSALISNFGDEYRSIMNSIQDYLENTLNDPRQTLFSFGGKLSPVVKSFKTLINLMVKLGYKPMAIQLLKYASNKYEKEKGI